MKKKHIGHGIAMDASEKFVTIFAYILMTVFALVAILPCLHVVSKAFSKGTYVTAGLVNFWPKGFQLETIKYILFQTDFFNALKNTLIVTIVGTAVSVIASVTTAYPLSKPQFKGRKVITLLYVFSMVFFGGMIPAYMVIQMLGIKDTYAAMILPFAIVQFNMFIVKNYFEGLPETIEESARIDGAGDLRILVSIVCPMSTPVIATVALLYAINYWNNYFHAMMYTQSPSMQTLQVYLYNLIQSGSGYLENMAGGTLTSNITPEGLTAAAVTLSIIPIILLYPFVQRFLIKGITIGSVKG
ncbi:MAG: carbohydrate ABC transporter permease [Clostridiales bacterium]|nr:carbohydrate ABC transporter permease [Clostridiales bacterium]MDD7387856.1 carbohydrate ABC transporter permease [Bacillota bacterium]MDY6041346.1 carbohydrate ABC transporter permease [Candidatus Faecousia sp.]